MEMSAGTNNKMNIVNTGKTDAGGTNAGMTSTGKTNAGTTSTGKTNAGKTDAGKTNTGMNSKINVLVVFIKKEIIEHWRSYRIIVLLSVLLLFGMSSPLIAKLVPVIFESIDMGIEINIPEPTFIDSYTQFFKNMTQVCLIVVILVFSGSITREKSRGTAMLLLSKGLSRTTFIISKFIAQVLIWTVSYAAAAAVFYGYTGYLFPGHKPQNFAVSMLSLWLFVVFLFSLSDLASLVGNAFYVPVVITFGALALMLAISAVPKAMRYLPIALSSWNVEMIQGIKNVPDIILPASITVVLTILFVVSTIMVFSKQEL
ncbi:MAG: ABC transporter permease [Clostridiaceae bacterium]|nr:ABC transporter permease [Clostridiaceae bacterium]